MTVIYGSNVADATLTTACQMSTTSGGTETSNTTTIASTSNPYAEIRSQGGASTAVAALPAPTGNGWIYWPGQAGTFATGNWSAKHTHSAVSHGVSTTIRFYKYSSGVYTSIGTITATQSVTTKTTYTHAATSMASVTLASTDGIYVDLWWFDNNANAGGDNPTNFISNSATIGVASDMEVTTSTFTPSATTVSRTVPTSAVLQSLGLARTIPSSGALKSLGLPRTIPDTAVLKSLGLTRTIPTSGVVGLTNSRTIPTSAVLTNSGSRTIPTSAVLQSLGLSRIIPGSAVLKSTNNGRTIPSSAVLSLTLSRTIPTSAVLTTEIASGGFALFGNTASGTVSFDSVRFTQYPDPALPLNRVLDRLGSSSISWNANTTTGTSAGMKTSLDGINFTTATNGGTIPGLTGQADPVIDIFNANTSVNYTNTSKSGGSVATVAYDTANSRITLSGGSGGLYLNGAITDDDIDLIIDMDESDAGGLTWRNQGDGLNYYELGCYDDSSTSGFTSQLRLYKVSAGTRSLLGSASAVTWYRSTQGFSPYKRIRVTMLGSIITVYFDGTVMQTYTDGSPLGVGKVGLRNDGGTSRYYQLRIQQQGDYVSGTPAGDMVTGKFVYLEQDLATTDASVGPQVLDTTISARSPNVATGAFIDQLHDPTKPFAVKYSDEMTSLAQASGDFWWDVDQDTGETLFAAREAQAAPFCLYSTDFLNRPATQSAGGTSGVQPTNSADTYRNQQIVNNTTSLVTISGEEKIANGTDTSWNLAYPLYSAPTITVGGVVKTVGVKGVDTGKDFYWQPANNTISQDSSAAKIPSGYILIFSYVGQYADQVIENNLAEQAARKAVEGGTGIVVDIVDGQGMLSTNAVTYAQGLLARNGNNDTVSLIGTTTRPGLQQGMVVPVFLPEFGLNNRQLLIMKLTASGYQKSDGTTFYEYTIMATDGPNLANWAAALGL